MQTIFIMIKCDLGRAYAVADALVQDIEQVSEVHSTSGQYDLLVKCYLGDGTNSGHFVNEKIQTLTGIKDTFNLIAFKAFAKSLSVAHRPLPSQIGRASWRERGCK